MAGSYDNTNSGVLFRNDRKTADTHPDYTGTANVNGVEYFMDAWIKESTKNPGTKFMSFRFKEKGQPKGQPTATKPQQGRNDEDEAPF
jgi:hypothetical protein